MTIWSTLRHWLATRRSAADSDPENGAIWFEGGDGRSVSDAIVIRGVNDDVMGTFVLFAFLEDRFGRKDRDWKLKYQTHGTYGDREIDTYALEMRNGEQLTLYFDITESFGKVSEDFAEGP